MAFNDTRNWQDEIFDAFKEADVSQIPYVPDVARSSDKPIHLDDEITLMYSLQKGRSCSCGAWLGGKKSVLLRCNPMVLVIA